MQLVISQNCAQIENNLMRQDLDRIQFAINDEESALSKLSSTMSIWDETYAFAEDGNSDYIRNYFIDLTFINAEINIFAVINNSGQIVKAKNYDLWNCVELALSEETLKEISNRDLLCTGLNSKYFGILQTSEGPLLIVTTPILTSQGEGPVHGTVLLGRFLDSHLIEKLSTITKIPVTFTSLADISTGRVAGNFPQLSPENPVLIKPLDAGTLAGYYLISDITGQPYLVVSTQISRDVSIQGRATFWGLFFGIIIVAVLYIIMSVTSLDRLVLSRMRVLTDFATRISRDGDISARVSLKGQDELTALSREMNAMLAKLSAANDRLSESENKYSTLVEKSSDGIILITGELVTYANNRMLQMVGLNKDEFLNSKYIDFVNPKYRAIAQAQYTSRLNGTIAEGPYEIQIDRKDHASITVEVWSKLIKLNNENCDMVILRDITERKQAEQALRDSEEKYRSLVNNIKLGIFRSIQGDVGKFMEVNQAMEVITGYSRDELFSINVAELYWNPEDRNIFLAQIISTPQRATHELAFKKKDKTQIVVSVTAAAVKDGNGKVIYFDGIVEDITERKQMEEKIIELYAKEKTQRQDLEQEAQKRTLFIDILAHELRNPLTPLISAAGMLQDITRNDPDSAQKKLITTIRNSSDKLARRLEELLDMARYSRGSFEIKRQPIEIKPYMEDVISRFKPSIEQRDQYLKVDIAEGIPVTQIDPSRLDQVLVNLLSNASKYSPAKGFIYFKAYRNENNLEVDVTDTGIGISPDEQKSLFQPYHRVDKSRGQGLGLGLIVCKQIVEAHGGTIWVTSQSGQGSTFSFRVPLA